MTRKDSARSLAAIMIAVASLAAGGAPAEDVQAVGLELVAEVPVADSTHFDFMTRVIAGEPHTLVLLGSREVDAPAGVTADGGLHVIDVSDPAHPVSVAHVPCKTSNNDVAVIPVAHTVNGVAYDRFIAMASNDGTGCIVSGKPRGAVRIIGVRAEPLPGQVITLDDFGANMVDPSTGERFRWTNSPSAHTIAGHPTEPVVYAANQVLPDRFPTVEIVDLSVWPPTARSVSLPETGVGPHDITFRPDGLRAYTSSINLSFVWDTTDPLNPEMIGVFDSPNLKVHHEATLHPDGRHVFVVDEFVNTSSGGVGQCPGGGIHVFDLGPNHEFESAPIPVGAFYAPDVSTPAQVEAADQEIDIGCTAHEYNFSPDGNWLPVGWTGAGVRVVDISAVWDAAALPVPTPVPMFEIGKYVELGHDIWAAKVHPSLPGFVFSSDTQPDRNPDGTQQGGLRILKLTGTPP